MNYRMLAAAAAISVCALGSASCSDDDPGPGPTGPPTTFVFTSALTAANEVPPVGNAESTANGTVTITLNVTRDSAGTITAATTTFAISVTAFQATSNITAAHIHPGVTGVNGSFIVNVGLASGELALTNGAGTITKSNIATTVTQANDIIANPAAFYFNVHSTLNPGGVARGQLVRQ